MGKFTIWWWYIMGKDDKFKEITEKLFKHMIEFMKIEMEKDEILKVLIEENRKEINELRNSLRGILSQWITTYQIVFSPETTQKWKKKP